MAAAALAAPAVQKTIQQGLDIANTPVIGVDKEVVTVRAYKSGRNATEKMHFSFTLRAWELALLGLVGVGAYAVETAGAFVNGASTTAKTFAEWMTGPIGSTVWTVENVIVPVAENPDTTLGVAAYLGGLPGLLIALIGEPQSKTPQYGSNGSQVSELWTWTPPIQVQMPPWVGLILPSVKQQ